MRNRFDMQLELLNEQLIHMGELCGVAIERATEALANGDLKQAEAVIKADEEIDQMEKDIEQLCLKLLLQQQPVARDLRQISAALKMITDMERIGDQAADIAEIIISEKWTEKSELYDISIMSEAVSGMVRESVRAYVEKDLALAQLVMDADTEVDRMFDENKENIVAFIAAKKGGHGKKLIDLIMITKYLERIGDHATNIAEWVEFAITGIHKDSQI